MTLWQHIPEQHMAMSRHIPEEIAELKIHVSELRHKTGIKQEHGKCLIWDGTYIGGEWRRAGMQCSCECHSKKRDVNEKL